MLKFLLKKIWSKLIYLLILFSNNFNLKVDSVKVFYGGARSGNVGGPLVKIKRLKKYFPEKLFCFNIVYLLSNSPFLSDNAIRKLKSRHVPIILNQNGIFFSWMVPWRLEKNE